MALKSALVCLSLHSCLHNMKYIAVLACMQQQDVQELQAVLAC